MGGGSPELQGCQFAAGDRFLVPSISTASARNVDTAVLDVYEMLLSFLSCHFFLYFVVCRESHVLNLYCSIGECWACVA